MLSVMDMGRFNACKNEQNVNKSKTYYKNADAIEKVVRYITRTRDNESRRNELIYSGGSGVIIDAPIESIINQLKGVQSFYGIDSRKGRRLMHLVIGFTENDFYQLNNDYALVDLIGRETSAYFFALGFQNVYAVHHDQEKKVHIHICISSVNYITGLKIQMDYEFNRALDKAVNTFFENAKVIAAENRGEITEIEDLYN
ncbi:MAG: relaxase/mobilization nuclease domain-containing protein [Eubacterium sp.]|nr:relaxase/mobilization nuclease domain-containing protein [Eubacterium sp.]